MTISAKDVKALREQSGAGMMECKKALVEACGDIEKAIEVLRKRGLEMAGKKSSRATNEGRVHSYIHSNFKVGVLIEVACETDFVARTDDFRDLVNDLAMQVAAASPEYVTRDEVPAEIVAKEKDIFREAALAEGKPEKIVDKIAEGKLSKFYAECCLLEQIFVKDEKRKATVEDTIKAAIAKTGENITVRRFTRYQLGA